MKLFAHMDRPLIDQFVTYILPSNLSAKQKIAVSYRYISWAVTALFYLTEPPYQSLTYKLLVVLALLVFSIVMNEFNLENTSYSTIRRGIFSETLGIALLLLPTGGIDSPFIWYALNPVLISAAYLRQVYSWLNLSFYLTVAMIITFKVFNEHQYTLTEIVRNKSYIILAYILMTVVLRLLSRLVNYLDNQRITLEKQRYELLETNYKLKEVNLSKKRAMEHIMSLYYIIEVFSANSDTTFILNQAVESTRNIMSTPGSFLWLSQQDDQSSSIIVKDILQPDVEGLTKFFNTESLAFDHNENWHLFSIMGVEYLAAPVKSNSRFYGYLGIKFEKEQKVITQFPNNELITFLADLIAVVLERSAQEKVSAELLIMEEQNRIANEIHDSVSQRLFSMQCSIHALSIGWSKMDGNVIANQLKLIEQCSKEASKELRTSIYNLSAKNKGQQVFQEDIKTYISDFSILNSIEVKFEVYGEVESLSLELKQAMHRIIREATGNAARHGKCTKLDMIMTFENRSLELIIRDNGTGFDVASTLLIRDKRGLGINNMQFLTQSFKGTFNLRSEPGVGTEIKIKIPFGYSKERGGAA